MAPVKSITSPANDVGKKSGGIAASGRTPLVRVARAFQNASLVVPMGVTMPTPVITTRRFDSPPELMPRPGKVPLIIGKPAF
jgi:hypothetical protein